jgi:DNA topoisomerase II
MGPKLKKSSKTKEKSVEDTYKKLSQREHIIKRPDTYVGSVVKEQRMMFVCDENGNIVEKEIEYVPALLKIVDEVLVNAADRTQEDSTCTSIKTELDMETGSISVWNNGKGLPVVIHQEHDMYVPSLIFGELLTGSNFDDKQERTTGGRNGYGAKLANIFSTKFDVETYDEERGLKFSQTFSDNMSVKSKPKITSKKSGTSYTKITFTPDYAKFGMDGMDEDFYSLIKKRTYDFAGVCKGTTVHFNGEKIKANNFKKYMDSYDFGIDKENSTVVYEDVNDRWSVGVIYSPNVGHKQISFVNAVNTFVGGTHVEMILKPILEKVREGVKKKMKIPTAKATKTVKKGAKKPKAVKVASPTIGSDVIKDNLIIFISSIIVNPKFDSQSKCTLITDPKDFGSICQLATKTHDKIVKSGIVAQINELMTFKANSTLNKVKAKKNVRLIHIEKLDDANYAGTTKSGECWLILTEGDSAKALARAGIPSQDYFGIFALKGKLLNVREASHAQIAKNEEVQKIAQILGLQFGKSYTDLKSLRYGKILIMTDQDKDGFHIQGLLMNFIHYFWPSLLGMNTFIHALQTPIVKATKGKQIIEFHAESDYEKWKEANNNGKGWFVKYYKGLGTSTSKEAKEYFDDFMNKITTYVNEDTDNDISYVAPPRKKPKKTIKKAKKSGDEMDEDATDEESVSSESISNELGTEIERMYKNETSESITLAFDKTRADDRKIWIGNPCDEIEKDELKSITYTNFIDKNLKLFSIENCARAIPSICDGLKPSQRKALFGGFEKKLFKPTDDMKVFQFGGFIADKAAYHHGDASINQTIISMGANYVGSNNLNLLFPSGQFGTRHEGGKDCASPRYTFTHLSSITPFLFRSEDFPVLNYLNDDGKSIEPEYYPPIIPTLLANGSNGIGTGYASTVQTYNPLDIIKNLRLRINKKKSRMEDLKPWFMNFDGSVIKSVKDNTWITYGKYERINDTDIQITELPIGAWTSVYKKFLTAEEDAKRIVTFKENHTDKKVLFTVTFEEEKLDDLIENKTIYSALKLGKSKTTNKMWLFNANGEITKYNDTIEIMEDFYKMRYDMYKKRKLYNIGRLEEILNILKYKMKFIKYVIKGKIVLNNQKKKVVVARLEELEFPPINEAKKSKDEDDEDDEDESSKKLNMSGYNYLLDMKVISFTTEKLDKLQKQLDDAEEELETVTNTTEKEQWLKELDELEEHYAIWHQERINEHNEERGSTGSIGKAKKTKKSKKVK